MPHTASVAEALGTMLAEDQAAVVVVDERGRLSGIATDRDLLKRAADRDPAPATIGALLRARARSGPGEGAIGGVLCRVMINALIGGDIKSEVNQNSGVQAWWLPFHGKNCRHRSRSPSALTQTEGTGRRWSFASTRARTPACCWTVGTGTRPWQPRRTSSRSRAAVCSTCTSTGTPTGLFRHGVELLVETARMWVDLGFLSERQGEGSSNHEVTGPTSTPPWSPTPVHQRDGRREPQHRRPCRRTAPLCLAAGLPATSRQAGTA